MNWKRFGLAALCVLLSMMTTGFLVHGVLLVGDYKALGSMMRNDEDAVAHFPLNLIAHIAMALAIIWINAKGVEQKPWLDQGLRFGFAFWLVGSISVYLIYCAVQPLPGILVTKQISYGLLESLLMGAVVAVIYRP